MWPVCMLVVTAEAGVTDRLFAPPDSDGDGVADFDDRCSAFAETHNGYADDDGCPDYLTRLVAVATHDGTLMPASLTAGIDRDRVEEGQTSLVVPELAPGTPIDLLAAHDCLEGAERIRVEEVDTQTVAVPLTPRLDATLELTLRTLDGTVPEDAVVTVPEARTRACAPQGPQPVPEGAATMVVGRGTFRLTASADGYAPSSADVTIDRPGVHALELVLVAEPATETDPPASGR